MIVDTHCHLYDSAFDADRDAALLRATKAGVSQILLPAIDKSTYKAMWQTVENNPELMRPMIGLHPCSVKAETLEDELVWVEKELQTNRDKYYAVGEIGIDLYWETSTKNLQIEAFRTQLQWAKQFKLPVAIHVRNSFDEVFEALQAEQDGNLRGVLHCFTGGKRHVRLARDLGFYFGIGGVLTYAGAGLDHVLKRIELSEMLLETDAPYLAPLPHKGNRNEPAYLIYIVEKMAEILKIPPEEIMENTTKNAQKLFAL